MSFAKALLLTAFLSICALSYMGPIIEGDFFWHLNAGKAIIREGEIPPLHYPTQWLGQAALYLFWKAFGYGGIVFLRAGVYTSILLGLFLWMRRAGVQYFVCMFFLIFPARIFTALPSERPQLFTFMLFPLFVWLLERVRLNERSKSLWILPLVLVLWGNVHGGVLLGVLASGIYFLAEAFLIARKKTTPRRVVSIGAVALLPVLAAVMVKPSLISSMAGTAANILKEGGYAASVQEYMSPYSAAKALGQYYPSYWIFLAIVVALAFINIRRMPPHHFLMLLAFSVLSLQALRFIPFLMMLAPVASLYSPGRRENLESGKAIAAGFIGVMLIWVLVTPMKVQPGVSKAFPATATKFIKYMLSTTNIFNYQAWAGYLTWELQGRDVFIPTEGVTGWRDSDYSRIIWADSKNVMGKPQWRALIDAYGIDTVVMPGISPISGEFFPLIEELIFDRQWYLIYSDDISNVFVRDKTRNAAPISFYSQPKGNALLQVIKQAKAQLAEDPGNKTLWRSLGEAQRKLGMEEEAKDALRKAGVEEGL